MSNFIHVCCVHSHTYASVTSICGNSIRGYHQGDSTSGIEDTTEQCWGKPLLLSLMNVSILTECSHGCSNDNFNFQVQKRKLVKPCENLTYILYLPTYFLNPTCQFMMGTNFRDQSYHFYFISSFSESFTF